MDPRSSGRQRVDELLDIADIAREYRFREFDCDGHEVCIDDISGSRAGEDRSDSPAVSERVDGDRRQESCQTCLTAAVAPHLRDDRLRRVQRSATLERCVQELLRRAFTAVNGHQKPGVEDHRS